MNPSEPIACQVVPAIPTFAVDDGFTYAVGDRTDVSVGSRVRIRVGGRRLRGYVTALVPTPFDRDILDIDGVVGTLPSFRERDLELLRWAATHYVTPLSTVLERTVPPNVPRSKKPLASPPQSPGRFGIESMASAAPHHDAVVEQLRRVGADAAMVVVPAMVEAENLAGHLRSIYGDRVVIAHSGLDAKTATKAWVSSMVSQGTILVGTREVALWPISNLARIVVVEDTRRVMKSPATPTFGVREIAIERARLGGFPVAFVSPMPSLEVLHAVATRPEPRGRGWGLIEVVDRTEEPPTSASVMQRTRAAVAGAVKANSSAFVLVPRRGYARAVRCLACSHLRTCPSCSAAGSTANACERCGNPLNACENCGRKRWRSIGAGIGSVVDELKSVVGSAVGDASANRVVTVGTERDLVAHPPVDLAIAVDIDSVSMAPTYRAPEDALRLLIRLSQLVTRGRGHRTMIQTSLVGQPVVEAMRSGSWVEFAASEMHSRKKSGFPPSGELIALEVRDADTDITSAIVDAAGAATVLGPAAMKDRDRWLIQGKDLSAARVQLRSVVRTARDRGAKVRVDVDPIDL
ncbi:MAG: hypothetical protein ACR2N2_00895 [Acidimicrobiia bacterium]